jgi:hypothetical protein
MRQAARLDRVPDIVVITGMSGSGRTQAMHVFEDMGYYCIDNLPPRLILDIANVVGINSGVGRHLAVTCDLRSQGLFDEMFDALRQLGEHELTVKLLFLDCSDEVLIRRYKETRRRHPVALAGRVAGERHRPRARAALRGARPCRPGDRHVAHAPGHAAQPDTPRVLGVDGPAAAGRERVLVRVQARHAGGGGPHDRRALPAKPVLRSHHAHPHGKRRPRARVRAGKRRHEALPYRVGGPARRGDARLHRRGQGAAVHRRRLHREASTAAS